MAFTPIPGGIEGTMRLTNNVTGQHYVNVYHFLDTRVGGVINSDVDDIANFLATTLWGVVRATITSNIKLLECTARDISDVGGYSKTNTTNTGQAGTLGNNEAPGNVAISLSWRTAGTGRRNRGRSYYSGLDEGHVGGDRIDTTVQAALFQIGAALLGAVVSGQSYFAVRSIADIAMKVVTAFVVDTALDSQRNRLVNRGT
jgi:hypothetical protein